MAQLAAAESSSRSLQLTAPASPGAYYYGACVDPVRDESDTTNNCSTSVQVTVPETETEPQPGPEPEPERHPDLVVSSPSVSDSGPAGGAQFTLSATVRNAGEGVSGATTLRYYQSTDATITTSDTALATVAIAGLAAAGSSSQSVDPTAPSRPGTYYYGACVDPVTDESDTTNNCSASVPVTVPEPEPERHPDLVVMPPSVSDSGPAAGAQFTLSATVRNAGEGDAAATTLRYYRSTDTTIMTSDTEVGMDAVAELAAAGSSSQSVDLTAPSRPGTYYYGACVAPVPDETDTTNNCSASVPVTVPEPKRPDLVVTLPRVNDGGPAAGAEFTLSATVRNDGEGTAAGTTLSYYLSTDATITAADTSLETVAIAGLAGSGSSSQSVDLTAPSRPGTYYYGACVDAVPDETDTTNNCSTSVQVTVQVAVTEPQGHPDLVVESPSVNDSGPSAGAEFTLSAAVRNDGEGTAATTTLSYYQSTDATITATDTLVGTVAIAGLAAAGSSSQSVDLTAPSSPGTYYYGACVDAVPDETDTTNNCSASVPVTVPEPKRPDLVVTLPRVNDSGPAAGAEFTLSATVRNDGEGAAAATTLIYYQSTDATITAADTSLETVAIAGLAGSGSSSQSVELTAPSSPGTYYYGACVDAVPDETDTTNNCSASVPVTVPEPKRPDLVVTLPRVNDSGPAAGAEFTLSATVRNDGEGAAAATTLSYYQSTDATITPADTLVGTAAIAGLAAAGSSSQSVDLTALSRPGTYYYGACVDAVPDETDTTNNCSGSVTVTVSEPEESALSVEISAEDDKEWAPVGDTVDLSARVLDDEGEEITGTTVTWSSSNIAVATVDSSGVMTAEGEGTVTLTATATVSASSTQSSMARSGAAVVKADQTVTGSVSMIVVKRAARIDLSPASLSFDSVGEYATLTATVYDEDDNVMRPTYWGWSSADRAVATASNRVISSQTQGFVQAIGAGTTTVSVSVNGSARGTASVTVTLPKARVEVSPIELDFEALGTTKTVTVRVLDDNGDEDEDASFGWTTVFSPCCGFEPGDTIGTVHTARVDDGLEVTAGGTGSGRITITSEDEDVEPAFVLVRVYQVSKSLTLSPDSASLAVGETATLRASVMDANGYEIRLAEGNKGGLVVYWETSDSDVATVVGADHHPERNTGATATVTAAAAGTATITGRHRGDVTGTATITVTAPQPDLVVGSPSVKESAPAAGAPFTLSATVTNDGKGESAATTLRYYRSTDPTITTSDTEVGTDEVEGLAASGARDESISLTAPDSPGTYYYGACVDAVSDEPDTTNNCSASMTVTVPEPGPDLVVVFPSVSFSGPAAGAPFTLYATVSNSGEASAAATVLRYYRSPDATITTTDIQVGTDTIAELAASGRTNHSVDLTAPAPGKYYYGACVDAVTDESDTANNCSRSVPVFVQERVARIEVTPDSVSFDAVGATARLSATLYDDDDNEMQATSWGWSTANPEVATVHSVTDSPRRPATSVQAIGEGTTTVTLSANGGATGTATVTVTLPAARVAVSPIELNFEALGATKTVTVRVLDENGDEDEDASFNWRTTFQACCGFEPGDTIRTLDIVKVDDGLEITAQGTGKGSIKITSPDVEPAIVLVNVDQVPESLTISPDSVSLAVDETATLRASVMDANGNDMPLAEGDKGGLVVYWETSDSDVATVVGVNGGSTGRTATVTAAAAGTATITGRWGGYDYEVIGTATITVTDSG